MVVSLEKKRGYLLLTFNTGGKYNVFNSRFMLDMIDALGEVEKIRDPHYLVIRGENGNFGSGADIRELSKASQDKEFAKVFFGHMYDLFVKLMQVNKVTIALVEGVAFGASLEALLVMDFVLAKRGTRFAAPGAKLGVFPPVLVSVGPYLLGHRVSRKLAMLGEEIDTSEAKNAGLIDVEVEDLDRGLLELLDKLRFMAPSSLVRMRKIIMKSLIPHLEGAFEELTTQVFSDEAREGISAFLSKIPPGWSSVGFS